uniref:Caffeic acid O-methyl transferase n=1 Tax=Pinus radiata TaxID=3347 RepID=A0A0A7E9L1_PINRA|nr:caffeic acid O-methyl transferase [Pinus radiata]
MLTLVPPMDSIHHVLAPVTGQHIDSSPESAATQELQLYEMIFSAVKPLALKAAVLLNIPDIIATRGNEGPLSAEQIAFHIAAANSSSTSNSHVDVGYLYRILRFLASYGVFSEQEEADQADDADTKKIKFGLTGISKLLVQGGNQQSCGPFLLLIANNVYLEAFQHLHESVLEGCYTFNKAHGTSPWEYLGRNPQANQIFNEGVATNTRSVMASVAKMYEDGFKSMATLVDVGGGMGSALSIIVKEHSHIRGINLDQPHVIATAPPITGVEHMEGNMFEHIPSADAVMMKWIIHDWGDEECVKLLRRSYEATPAKGKVLIVEAIVGGDKEGESMSRRLGLSYDMLLMVYTTGGKERTEEEFKRLFQLAGFKSYTIIKLPFLQSLIVLSKA